MSRSTTLHLKMVIWMTRGFVGSHLACFALTKSTHFLRRLIASGRESPKKGMVCTNMPLEGSATLLQLAATHLSGIFWTTFLLVSVHNHADQFPRWRHRPNSTHSPSNSAVNQRGAYFQNFKNSQKIKEKTYNCNFFSNEIGNKYIFWWLKKKIRGEGHFKSKQKPRDCFRVRVCGLVIF